MADNNTQATGGTEGTTQTGAAAQSGQERTFTQQEVNSLVGAARQKERSKYADYDDLKAQAAAHADYDEVVAERDRLKAAEARQALVAKVAAESGVPASLVAMLDGADEESLAAQAAELAKALKSKAYPNVDDNGTGKPAITADDIRKMKDPRERIRARAEHPELFR